MPDGNSRSPDQFGQGRVSRLFQKDTQFKEALEQSAKELGLELEPSLPPPTTLLDKVRQHESPEAHASRAKELQTSLPLKGVVHYEGGRTFINGIEVGPDHRPIKPKPGKS